MKTHYYFELTRSCVPIIKGGKLIKDSNVGGIKNSYKVYKISYITLFNKWNITLLKIYIGTCTFLRPYKSLWPKKIDRLPKIYWGKHPILVNMWLLLIKDYDKFDSPTEKTSVLIYKDTTRSETIKVCYIPFESKLLKKNLQTNKSFSMNQKH